MSTEIHKRESIREPSIKVSTWHMEYQRVQQMRLTFGSGGPGGMEVILESTELGSAISMWNPYTRKWYRFMLPEGE